MLCCKQYQKENIITVAEKLREQGRQEGFEKGKLKGKLKEKKDIATNLLKNGQDIQFIANITGLSLQEVNELNKAFTQTH